MNRLTTRNYIDKKFEGYCFNGINTVKDYKEAYNSGYLTIVLSRAEEKLGQLEDFLEEHNIESLSDYTKQVRKEVCDCIRDKLSPYFDDKDEEYIKTDDLEHILEQIKGNQDGKCNNQ